MEIPLLLRTCRGSGLGARVHDFIAGGKNRDARRGEHFEARGSRLRCERHLRVAQARLWRDQQRARPRFAAARNNVIAASAPRDRA